MYEECFKLTHTHQQQQLRSPKSTTIVLPQKPLPSRPAGALIDATIPTTDTVAALVASVAASVAAATVVSTVVATVVAVVVAVVVAAVVAAVGLGGPVGLLNSSKSSLLSLRGSGGLGGEWNGRSAQHT